MQGYGSELSSTTDQPTDIHNTGVFLASLQVLLLLPFLLPVLLRYVIVGELLPVLLVPLQSYRRRQRRIEERGRIKKNIFIREQEEH